MSVRVSLMDAADTDRHDRENTIDETAKATYISVHAECATTYRRG